jgi:hypothetical protein
MVVRTTSKGLRRRGKRRVRKALDSTKGTIAKVPGPSNNPATNLMILDVAMRGASMIFGRGMEKALLRARYDPDKASDIVKGRSLVQSVAATGAARMATRSVPGFLLVTGGLLAKAVFDRSFSRRESVRRAEQQFAKQAQNADES